MIFGVAIPLVLIGIIFLFVLPWVGVAIALVGLALFVLWMAGFARQGRRSDQPTDRRA